MSESEPTASATRPGPQHGLGKTGGLPGPNADPRASQLTAEEIESTIAIGETARPNQTTRNWTAPNRTTPNQDAGGTADDDGETDNPAAAI